MSQLRERLAAAEVREASLVAAAAEKEAQAAEQLQDAASKHEQFEAEVRNYAPLTLILILTLTLTLALSLTPPQPESGAAHRFAC